jgi:Uma2 family endonuclease
MSSTLQRVRFTATDYTRMASILAGRRTELIDGEIIEMAPIGTAHLVVVDRLERHFASLKAEGRLQSGQPVRIRDYDEPQPDLTILHAPLGLRKPSALDCLLLIEVSDSTYTTDTTVKVPRYLAAGVPEVWVVNISDHRNPALEVWTPGASEPTMAREVVSVAGIDVPVAAIFDRLAEIPADEELGTTREGSDG